MSALSPGRVEGIDQLRGLAIALVVLRHAYPSAFPGAGVVGVVMFFALSGYLITGVLVDELESSGRVDLARFYLRRAVRLLPALLVLVLVVVAVTLVLDPLRERRTLPATVVSALTFTGDVPIGQRSDVTFHLWTLATEEQFYLLWPGLVLVFFARRQLGRLLAVALVGGLLAGAVTVAVLHHDLDLVYVLPTTWGTCFVVGAIARVGRDRAPRRAPVPPWAVVTSIGTLGGLCVISLREHPLTYLLGGAVIAAITALLLLEAHGRSTPAPRSAGWGRVPLRALALLGTVSYGAYLWNYPLTLWLRPSLPDLAGPLGAALTLVAAVLSWHLVEKPAGRFGRRALARRARPEGIRP